MIPKVSVIVPIYNTMQTLEKCINSIMKQTLNDIEIILVNDGSPDDAGILCDKIASTDSRIKVIHKKNGGLSDARNSALEIINGEYFGFVDSDDYISPEMYEKLYNTAIVTKSDIVMCQHYTVTINSIESHNGKDVSDVKEYEGAAIWDNFILPLLGIDMQMDSSSQYGFVWRQLFSNSKFGKERFMSEREFYAEDIVFDLTVYPKAMKISAINAALYYYVYNENSLTNKYRKNLWDTFRNLLNWEISFTREYNIEKDAISRLANTAFKLVIVGILNLHNKRCPLNNKMKKAEILRIITDPITMNLLRHSQTQYYPKINRIVYLLVKVRYSSILHFAFKAKAYFSKGNR